MDRCVSCGKPQGPAAQFCGGCGRAATRRPGAESCAKCGAAARPGAAHCGQCGARLVAPAGPPRAAPLPPVVLGAAVAIVVAAGAFLAVLLLRGGSGDSPAARLEFAEVGEVNDATVAAIEAAMAKVPPAAGATDRDQVQSRLGLPDAFVLTFEREGEKGDGRLVRYETWYYFDLLSAFEFADGLLVSNLPIAETEAEVLLPPAYDPGAFRRTMTWDEAAGLLPGAASFEPRPLPPEFEADVTFYAGGQLVLAFDDEGLLYVESVPLSLEAQ